MRPLKYLASFAACLLVLSIGAFAKDTNSGTFDLTQSARVGMTELQPGHYKAEWTGSNSALKVSILENGKTIATAQGKLKELPKAAPYDAVTIRTLSDQSNALEEIQFNNRKAALMLSRS
jgi:hypothetical protein